MLALHVQRSGDTMKPRRSDPVAASTLTISPNRPKCTRIQAYTAQQVGRRLNGSVINYGLEHI